MTLNRYTDYSVFSKAREPTRGIIASAIVNGVLQELRISDDGSQARWITDRIIFPPETMSYGGMFPCNINDMFECGLYCKYQEDFDSAGKPYTFTPIVTEGGIATLSKIAPLYDIHSLMLTSMTADISTAGLFYNAATANSWATLDQQDASIEFHFKAHRALTEGATLWLAFNGAGPNNFGLNIAYSSGAWTATIIRNGTPLSTTITVNLEEWNYVILNKTKDIAGSSTYTIYLNGTSIFSSISASPVPVAYTTFAVLGTGLTATGTSFFVSNLRVDVNTIKTAFTQPYLTDLPDIGKATQQLWVYDNSALDPFFDKVTCLLRHDRNISYVSSSSGEKTVPTADVTGYCKVEPQGIATSIDGASYNVFGSGLGILYSDDPTKHISPTLTGFTQLYGQVLSIKGFLGNELTSPPGTYLPWLRVNERNRNALTTDGDFTFEFWTCPLRANAYIFNTTGGIALVDGTIVGIGATFSIGTFGVTTGLQEWSHVALSRVSGQLRVFINAVEVASVARSGIVSFDGLELGNSPGVSTGAKFFMGSFGQLRFTKAGRYVIGADVVSAVLTPYTRVEYADSINTIYDPKTDFCYGLVDWTISGVEGGASCNTRLTLFKFDPRAKEIVARRDIWRLTNLSKFPLPYSYPTLISGVANDFPASSRFTLVGNDIVLARGNTEFEFFSKTDLTTSGIYSSWKTKQNNQHRMLIEAGADQYVTWQRAEYSVVAGSEVGMAVSDPGTGHVVLQLHFSYCDGAYIFKDMAGHPVNVSGIVYDTVELASAQIPRTLRWNSTRAGLITIPSSEDFAFKGDFTIEFDAVFQETTAGAITACTPYSQTGISISASNFTLTANVFGSVLTFVGTGTGNAATFGASTQTASSISTGTTKTHNIVLCRHNGVVRLFLNGVLAQKVTQTAQGVASAITLGDNCYGTLDELTVWNGYAKYTTDTTFIPSRYIAATAGQITASGIPIVIRQENDYNHATGIYPLSANTLVTGRRSRLSHTGYISFDQELQSPVIPFPLDNGIDSESVVYHESTNSVWVFGSHPFSSTNGAGYSNNNIGYRWDLATNTLLPIPKQGNMAYLVSLAGGTVCKFDTVNASNLTPDFGTASNFGLTIDQAVSRAPFYGSLLMSKAAGRYARTAAQTTTTSVFGADWTIEVWYYNPVLQAEVTPDILVSDKVDHSPRWEIGVQRSAVNCLSRFRVFNGNMTVALPSLSSPAENVGVGTWAHLAIVKSGLSVFGYTNGVKTHELLLSTLPFIPGTFSEAFIGSSSLLTNFATGRIQEISITIGAARYVNPTYVIPTEPFSLKTSSFPEPIRPHRAWAYKDDIILSAAAGTNIAGAYQFNSAGVLKHTYGFSSSNDNPTLSVNGIAPSLYLGPRIDIEPDDLDIPGIETHALYGMGSAQNPYLYVWDLGVSSATPSRRIRYTSSAWPNHLLNNMPSVMSVSSSITGVYESLGSGQILDQAKAGYRNVPLKKSIAANRTIGVDFEDIINTPAVPQPDTYGDVPVGTFYQASCQLTFGAEASVSRSYSFGGVGRFGPRTPTAARGGEAAMTLTSSPCVISSSHETGFINGLSFWHASSASFTVELWSLPNAGGSLVGSSTVTPTGTCNLADVNNIYCTWAKQTVTASSSFKSIKIISTPGTCFIDNLTFGSLTPIAGGLTLINGSNIAASGYVTSLPSTPIDIPTPAGLVNGLITADMTAPYTATGKDTFLPFIDTVPTVNSVNWHRINHDGTRSLKITLMQPSSITQSALQDHNVNAYLGVALYDSTGNIVQRLYQDEEMMSYIGAQRSASESTIVRPYHLPLVIPKSFPVGDYYIATINRKPTGPRLYEGGVISGAIGTTTTTTGGLASIRTALPDYGFDQGISSAPDTGRYIQASVPVLAINGQAMPPTDVISSYTIETQGISAATLFQNLVAPLAGTGSLEFNLAAVGPSQEIVTEDPLFYSNVIVLSRLDQNYTDLVSNKAQTGVTNAFTTVPRFGTGGMARNGTVTWTYTGADLPLPDRNAFTFDMHLFTPNYYTMTSVFRLGNASLSQSLTFTLARDYLTTDTKYKLTVVVFDSVGFGGQVMTVSTGLFDIPPDAWSHFAIVKSPPVANISTVYVYINGLQMASVPMSVATGYINSADRLTVNLNSINASAFSIDDFRFTNVARWTGPFTPPHYQHPSIGVGLPAAPTANFTADVVSGIVPLTVNFTNTSSGYQPTWAWDYTDDAVVDATTQNASFTYSTAGTYTARLTATNAGGATSATRTITVSPYVPVVRTIDFNALAAGDGPGSYYNGGYSDSEVGPGPALGTVFPYFITGVISSTADGAGGRVASPYYPSDPIYMNYGAGFLGPIQLKVQSSTTVTITCYAGLNGSSTIRGTATGTYGNISTDTYSTVNITLTGSCKSIVISTSGQLYIDDITFTV